VLWKFFGTIGCAICVECGIRSCLRDMIERLRAGRIKCWERDDGLARGTMGAFDVAGYYSLRFLSYDELMAMTYGGRCVYLIDRCGHSHLSFVDRAVSASRQGHWRASSSRWQTAIEDLHLGDRCIDAHRRAIHQ